MKCWPEPCTSLKDMFKNLSRWMDFHGNADALKICVVGMKSYPSLFCGVMLLLFVKVKNTLRCSFCREFPGCSRLGFSTSCTPDFSAQIHICMNIWIHFCVYRIKICTGVTTLTVFLCWAKMNSINLFSRHLISVALFFLLLYLTTFMNADMKIIKLISSKK